MSFGHSLNQLGAIIAFAVPMGLCSPITCFAYDSVACKKYAFERNKTLPENKPGYTSTFKSVECIDPTKLTLGTFVMHAIAKGRDNGRVTADQKMALARNQQARFKPLLCEGLKTEYWFADKIEYSFEDEAGKFIYNVPISRTDCK